MTADTPVDAGGLLRSVADRLCRGEDDVRRREARLLLALSLGREDPVLPHEDILFPIEAKTALDRFISRRNAGEPISRLRGWREFYSLRFDLNQATLDPRPDSEVVVDTALHLAQEDLSHRDTINVVDFGTGSGCLLLSVLQYLPNAKGMGVDISPDAIDAARRNAENLGLDRVSSFQVSCWDDALDDARFDLVISNPPYIATAEIDTLEPEVRCHDPVTALDGGVDGLVIWRTLLPVIARRLTSAGRAVVEIGHDQADTVASIATEHGLKIVTMKRDLGGLPRCLVLQLHSCE